MLVQSRQNFDKIAGAPWAGGCIIAARGSIPMRHAPRGPEKAAPPVQIWGPFLACLIGILQQSARNISPLTKGITVCRQNVPLEFCSSGDRHFRKLCPAFCQIGSRLSQYPPEGLPASLECSNTQQPPHGAPEFDVAAPPRLFHPCGNCANLHNSSSPLDATPKIIKHTKISKYQK